jgi:hypothetical protein
MISIKGKERRGHAMGVAKPITSLRIAQIIRNKKQRRTSRKTSTKKGGKSKGYFKNKKYGQAHIGEEWNSDEESSSSDEEEEVANIAIQSTSSSRLFTNLSDDPFTPTCLLAKGTRYICLMLILLMMMLMMNIA